MNERDAFKTDNIGLEMENRELEAKLASLEKEMGSIKQEITSVQAGNAIRQLMIITDYQQDIMNFRMHRKIL